MSRTDTQIRPPIPHSIENLSFPDAVRKQLGSGYDPDVEGYLIESAKNWAKNPDRPNMGFPTPDWSKAGEEVRHEVWHKDIAKPFIRGHKAMPAAHYDRTGRSGMLRVENWEGVEDQPRTPTIRHFKDAVGIITRPSQSYIHEGLHHLTYSDVGIQSPGKSIHMRVPPHLRARIGGSDTGKQDWPGYNPHAYWKGGKAPKWATIGRKPVHPSLAGKWESDPKEIISEAAEAKRRYMHEKYGGKTADLEGKTELSPQDVREILKYWKETDRHKWFQHPEPEGNMPDAIAEEAIKLSKADTRQPGMFTGPQRYHA